METDPSRMCGLLVGLGPEVKVAGVMGRFDGRLQVWIRTVGDRPACPTCGGVRVVVKDRPTVHLTDLPVFGRPVVLSWRKYRWECVDPDCDGGSWTETNPAIAGWRAQMTARAGRWVTLQVGRYGRPVSDLATELGCAWSTVNTAVISYGQALLDADVGRVGGTDAIGLDEILGHRSGRYKTRIWATTITDVRHGQLIDVVPGRTAAGVIDWIDTQPTGWTEQLAWGVLDLSGPYRKVYTDALPKVAQVADPFHLIRLANQVLDEVRRRVQIEQLGSRGRKGDPLYGARKPLVMACERLDDRQRDRLEGLLADGDPHGEIRDSWHVKETLRWTYSIPDPDQADAFVTQLADELQDPALAPEVNRLGRTIARWRTQIVNWHRCRLSNGPTEGVNNLVKRVKRTAFGITNFTHLRVRALLYAGGVNWALLPTLNPA